MGRFDEAQSACEAAKSLYLAVGDRGGVAEINAHILLSRMLLLQGKAPEAEREIRDARSLLASTQNRAIRLRFALVAANVRAAAESLRI